MKVRQSTFGPVVQFTPEDIESARLVEAAVDTLLAGGLSSGAALGLSLMADAAVLHIPSLQHLAAAQRFKTYAAGEWVCMEWALADGWRDRRFLPPRTQQLFTAHRQAPSAKDLHEIDEAFGAHFPHLARGHRLEAFVGAAAAHWARHLPPVLVGHAVRAQPFQPLDIGALARRESMLPLAQGDDQAPSRAQQLAERILSLRLTTGRRSQGVGFGVTELMQRARQLSAARGPKSAGRADLSKLIDELLPSAAAEESSLLLLGAARHLIDEGGIDGRLLALTTIADYLGATLPPLQQALAGTCVQELDSQGWQRLYQQVIQAATPTQQAKIASCLEAMHRFLVMCGVEPLSTSLVSAHIKLPPAAATVWPHELEQALKYADHLAPTDQVRWQARLILLLAHQIPCRAYDPWALTLKDVRVGSDVHLDIAPSTAAGGSKSLASVRQLEVQGQALATALIDARDLRERLHCAGGNDFLLGERGNGRARHEPELTMRVVNESLRLSTGVRTASFYDLRHAAISSRADALLSQPQRPTDEMEWEGLAGWAGHASSKSTLSYVHCFERAIAEHGKAVMPAAWTDRVKAPMWDACFPPIARGRAAAELPPLPAALGIKTDCDERWQRQACFFQHMAMGESSAVSAGKAGVSGELARAYLMAFERALDDCGLVPDLGGRMDSFRQTLPQVLFTFWRAAQQQKYQRVAAQIGSLVVSEHWRRLSSVWEVWRRCLTDVHIGLDMPTPAIELLAFLLEAGVLKGRLVLVPSEPASRPLDPRVARLLGARRAPTKQRRGLPCYRLALADSQVDPRNCRGASASMLGLHWLMLMARVAELTADEKNCGN